MKKSARFFLIQVTLGILLLSDLGGAAARSATTWDADNTTTGAQDGSGTWTSTSTNFWNGTTNAAPIKGTDATITFGVTGGSAGTITLSNGGSYLDYADSTSSSSAVFAQGYTVVGAAAGDGLSIGNLQVNAGLTVTVTALLNSGNAGTKTWLVGNGSTLNLSGGGALQNLSNANGATGTFNITGGTWTTPGNVTFGGGGISQPTTTNIVQTGGTITGNFKLSNSAGNSADVSSFLLNGGTFTNSGTSQIVLGSSSTATTGNAVMEVRSGTFSSTPDIYVGNGANVALSVTGGTFTETGNMVFDNTTNATTATTSTFSISGGTSTIGTSSSGGIKFGNGSAGASGTTVGFSMSGGTLYLGAGGFTVNATAPAAAAGGYINLSGGTLGAVGNWATSVAMNLSGGTTTFQTSDAGGTAHTIGINSVISGAGGLNVTGASTLTLNGVNTYSGGTTVTAGTLATGTTGTLGSGNVVVSSGAHLTLGNGGSINDGSTLTFDMGSTINLNFSGTETLGSLFDSNSSLFAASGTYSASQLDTLFGVTTFTGTGLVDVLAVPEPSSWLLLIGGSAFLFLSWRWRKHPVFLCRN